MGCFNSKQKEQASEMIGKGLDQIEQRTGPKGDQLVEKVRGEINQVLGVHTKPGEAAVPGAAPAATPATAQPTSAPAAPAAAPAAPAAADAAKPVA